MYIPEENALEQAYLGKYKGFVRDVNDPEKRGRIRIYCPAVFGSRDDSSTWLDWALPCFPPGQFSLPKKGDGVWVEFECGDVDYPIWVGLWLSQDDLPASVKDHYPKDMTLRSDEADAEVTLGTKQGELNLLGKEVHLGSDFDSPAEEAVIWGTTFRKKQKTMNSTLSSQLSSLGDEITKLGTATASLIGAISAIAGALGAAAPQILLPSAGAALTAAVGTVTGLLTAPAAPATPLGIALHSGLASAAAKAASKAVSTFEDEAAQDYLSEVTFTK
jgi:Type VI secretion system/phage-baseplate injector OB domain